MESLSSKIKGPLATLQMVGPVILACATTKLVVAELSVIWTLNVFDPPEFVTCTF